MSYYMRKLGIFKWKRNCFEKCSKCRSNIKRSRKSTLLIKNTRKPNILRYNRNCIYCNSLTSLSNTNEVYEGENELNMSFDVELSTLINAISENNGSENIENVSCWKWK